MDNKKITIKKLQKLFYFYYGKRYEMVAPNIYLDWEFNEMDLMCLRKNGFVEEIEIKFSKSDFLIDFKKIVNIYNGRSYDKLNKHECIEKGLLHCNRFSFLIPDTLIGECVIPEYAGLYFFYKNRRGNFRIGEDKKAPLLHRNKISDRLKYEVGRKMSYRYWNTIKTELFN